LIRSSLAPLRGTAASPSRRSRFPARGQRPSGASLRRSGRERCRPKLPASRRVAVQDLTPASDTGLLDRKGSVSMA
jgi:hypothetical protein